jgi:rod shape-determining protein MreC
MQKQKPLFLIWQDYLVLLFVIVVSTALMFFKNDNVVIGGLEKIVVESIAFLQKPFSQISTITNALERNKELVKNNANLLIRNSRMSEAYIENQRLRNILKFELNVDYNCVPAKVLGRSGFESMRSIIIDAGNIEGLAKNQTIVSTDGFVGKIIKVYEHSSVGQLLTDRNFRAGARIRRSRVEGIAKWNGDNLGILTDTPKRADVKIGDVVVTSGTSALFLPGIKIGVVVDIMANKSSMFQEVYFKPSVDFSKLEEVIVIIDQNEKSID